MSDERGLGCLPSPVDPADWSVAQLLEGPARPLPKAWAYWPIPPVLDQGNLPQCVAYSSAGLKMWQERIDEGRWQRFDTAWLYARCKALDGAPNTPGTTIRSALRVLKGTGIPEIGVTDAETHRIAAYYAVPKDVATLKRVLYDSGPVLLAIRWYRSWFHPLAGGILPKADTNAGGHAVLVTGWDDERGFLVRNSWGRDWGSLGNFWFPYSRLAAAWELWRAVDA